MREARSGVYYATKDLAGFWRRVAESTIDLCVLGAAIGGLFLGAHVARMPATARNLGALALAGAYMAAHPSTLWFVFARVARWLTAGAAVLALISVLGACSRAQQPQQQEPPPPRAAHSETAASALTPAPSSLALPPVARPASWAQPLRLPGLPNSYRVSDDYLRGAQPSSEGMRALSKLGVKTVVNLRSFNSDRDEIGDLPLAYEHITMKAWHAEDKEVVRFLQIVSDRKKLPVFVHCQHGADRTGTMTAIYRVAIQGWKKEDAIAEMKNGGFGYHAAWENLIRYLRNLDIERLKREAGVSSSVTETASSR